MKNSNCNAIRALMFGVVLLALTVDAWAATRNNREATPQQEQWEKYRLILDRNMFSRQRGPIRRAGDGTEPNVVVPNPETHFVLKGVVQQDREFIAFIEDTQAGRVLRLRQDGRVARGMVKALDLDGIEYELEGHVTAIKLGYDLEGRLAPIPVSAAPPAAPTGASTTSTPQSARRAQAAQLRAGQSQSSPTQTSQPQASPAQPNPPQAGPAQTPAVDEAEILKRLMEQRQQELGQP